MKGKGYLGYAQTFTTHFQFQVDFIRMLPVQISKNIFGCLTEGELFELRLVSKHWYFLANQVRKEFILKQIATEDVMVMQVRIITNELYTATFITPHFL